MPKPAKRNEPCTEELGAVSDHDYNNGMECTVQLANEDDFPSLPLTPSKPPLAKKLATTRVHSTSNTFVTDDTVQKLADLINSRSDALESMIGAIRTDMKAISEKVTRIEQRVEKSEETTQKCLSRVADLESYGRRWNLRLHGVPEIEKENVREQVIGVCQQVLPALKEKLPDVIDVAHRVGRRRHDDPKPRGVIIRFISRRHKEELWKAAKNCTFLQAKGLRFTEDLTKEEKENRQKLWPKIKKARDDGKAAYFVEEEDFASCDSASCGTAPHVDSASCDQRLMRPAPHATSASCHPRLMPPAPHATRASCHPRLMPPAPHVTRASCHPRLMSPVPHVSSASCLQRLMSPAPHVTRASCHPRLMSPAPHVTRASCHPRLMSPAPHVSSASCLQRLMSPAPHVSSPSCDQRLSRPAPHVTRASCHQRLMSCLTLASIFPSRSLF
ncbi:hypothetical protein WMY93_016682 [Mugilogobius chulae]|uniref:L1 transposable element RRM domain-containing protein n=1 Tax=Mugilogobius chulae TaxID=88201 RepID=A0AAW0NW83_9GOBI